MFDRLSYSKHDHTDIHLDLKVFNTKWLGDDVRIAFRSEGMDPDFSRIMTEYGLQPGDRPGTDLLPRLWEASS